MEARQFGARTSPRTASAAATAEGPASTRWRRALRGKLDPSEADKPWWCSNGLSDSEDEGDDGARRRKRRCWRAMKDCKRRRQADGGGALAKRRRTRVVVDSGEDTDEEGWRARMRMVGRRDRVEHNEGGEWCELADTTGPYHYPAWVAETARDGEVGCERRGHKRARPCLGDGEADACKNL